MEWPERGMGALPPADLGIRIDYAPDGRDLDLVAESERGRALLSRLAQTERASVPAKLRGATPVAGS